MHCHIDLYANPGAVLDRVVQERIYVLAVTTTPLAWRGTSDLTALAPRVQVGLGLHPELVAQRHQEVDLLCSMIGDAKYIGEVGLDGSPPHKAVFPLQQRVFDRILEASTARGGRLMTIHSRGAVSAVLDSLQVRPSAGTAILHWFSGTRRELERAVRMGCWFSVGPAMLRTKKGKALAEAMPKERVLTETDGPFGQKARQPLMPWDVVDAVNALASLWKCDKFDANKLINNNLRTLLAASRMPRQILNENEEL
jgi:TatD DNase family protein